VSKGEQVVQPVDECATGRGDLTDPFQRARLIFDVGVRRGDGTDRLASGDFILTRRISILKLDAQSVCQTVADSGGSRI